MIGSGGDENEQEEMGDEKREAMRFYLQGLDILQELRAKQGLAFTKKVRKTLRAELKRDYSDPKATVILNRLMNSSVWDLRWLIID